MNASRQGGDEEPGLPRPSQLLPPLDPEQLDVLAELGRRWPRLAPYRPRTYEALPVDPDLGEFRRAEVGRGPFGRLAPVGPLAPPRTEDREGEETTDASPEKAAPTPLHRARRLLLGAPLRTTTLAHESMRKLVALPVLAADALSSVAYGPEALLAVLVLAGSAGLAWALPIAATIAFLMLAVGASYRQTIRAYPHGGGSYIVASDNLGRMPGLLAAGGLLIDYVLTVAVSLSAGIAAVTSALPALRPAVVPLGLATVAVLLLGNLRGVRQAGMIFAAPTYAFLIAVVALVVSSLVDAAHRDFVPVPPTLPHATEGVSILLVMRAFASGSTAMTGIEAISNAVPAFRPVRWRNARTTLTWMIGLLIALFAGVVASAHFSGVVPGGNQTILSHMARLTFGPGFLYGYTQAATAAVLLLAANTAYNDCPRVLHLLARDDHAPHLFQRQGDRLAFNNGITALSVTAALVFVAFDGQTAALIPLYAVGVFLAFTLSQAGMVVHWHRRRTEPHRRKNLLFNATGCVLSGLVLVTAAVTKFLEGAWVALLAIAAFVVLATRVRGHYARVRAALRLRPQAVTHVDARLLAARAEPEREGAREEGPACRDEEEETPQQVRHLTVVALAVLDLSGLRALAYAASLGQPLLALHISPDEEEADRFREYWERWGDHVPLHVVLSPYRALIAPLVHYIATLHAQRPELTITVVLPEIVPRHPHHRLLHSHDAARLRRALRPLPKIVITEVPFHVP
ncbi:APC family permease [Streptomyces sp. NRRL F-5630]|uniref:APC family permease n=1 Tax=Streptomyces sp. NRRL F-5630 TaxID=1463864 RepID=UPI003EBEA102